MVTSIKVQNRIKKKYGSVSNFLRSMSWTQYEYRKALKTPSILNGIVGRIEARPKVGGMDPEKLKALKAAIIENGGMREICIKLKVPQSSVFQILQGRRKRMTPKVQALFDHFGI